MNEWMDKKWYSDGIYRLQEREKKRKTRFDAITWHWHWWQSVSGVSQSLTSVKGSSRWWWQALSTLGHRITNCMQSFSSKRKVNKLKVVYILITIDSQSCSFSLLLRLPVCSLTETLFLSASERQNIKINEQVTEIHSINEIPVRPKSVSGTPSINHRIILLRQLREELQTNVQLLFKTIYQLHLRLNKY